MIKPMSPIYINVKGRLLDLATTQVMGILNVTPDSFYSGSRMQTEEEIAARARQILDEGASIIDIGAYSSRPNAEHISAEEEMRRLRTGLEILNRNHPEAIISVDTFRAEVAERCVKEYGVAIINDIAAGEMDDRMFATVAELGVPYIMMHMQGTPQSMQKEPHYENLIKEVFLYFARKVQQLRDLGVKDIILDPGFGFGKNLNGTGSFHQFVRVIQQKCDQQDIYKIFYSNIKKHGSPFLFFQRSELFPQLHAHHVHAKYALLSLTPQYPIWLSRSMSLAEFLLTVYKS